MSKVSRYGQSIQFCTVHVYVHISMPTVNILYNNLAGYNGGGYIRIRITSYFPFPLIWITQIRKPTFYDIPMLILPYSIMC